MTDNVVRLKARRGTSEDRRAAVEEATRARLSAAAEIADTLRNTHRTELADRPVFARNLGRMWREAFPAEATPSLLSLFERAFGSSAKANYKKRPRFLRFEDRSEIDRGQKAPDEPLNAHGRNFVDLAEKIAEMAHERKPDDAIRQAKQRAILQLIDGSSLDRQYPAAARLRDAAVEELVRCCERIVGRIEAEVDLDQMRAVLQQDAVAAVIDGNGAIETLCERVTWDDRDSELDDSISEAEQALWTAVPEKAVCALSREERDAFSAARHLSDARWKQTPNERPVPLSSGDLDIVGERVRISGERVPRYLAAEERVSCFAPRVVLGDVLSPIEHDHGAVVVDIDEEAIEQRLQIDAAAYQRAIERHRLAGNAPAFDRDRAYRPLLEEAVAKALALRFGYPEDWVQQEVKGIGDLSSRVEEDNDGSGPPNDPWGGDAPVTIHARRRLELQLAFDRATERWRLCLALVNGVEYSIYGREGVYGVVARDGAFDPSLNLGLQTEGIIPGYWGILFLHRIARGRFMLYAVESEDYTEERVLGIYNGCLPIPSDESLDALLMEIEDGRLDRHVITAPVDDRWNMPAPAKAGTIAGMVLRNLAYAPEDERYDLLLLEDARSKARMMADFAKARWETYRAAIRRLET